MSVFVLLLLLCALPGILAGILQVYIGKHTGDRDFLFRSAAAYTALFYGILSAVKTVFDGGGATLAESFADAVPATCLHYLPPLVLLALIIPGLVTRIFRRMDLPRLIAVFDSFLCLLLLPVWVVGVRISNALYIAAVSVSALAALGVTLYWRGGIQFFDSESRRRRCGYAVPVTLFYVVTVDLVLPGVLFLNNRDEITVYPVDFARALLTGAVVHFIVIAGIGVLLLTWRQLELFYTFLFAVTLAGYLQDMLLNKSLQAMDGGLQEWSRTTLWINNIVWIALIGGIFLLRALLRKKNVRKAYAMIAGYLCLVQAVSLGYLAVSQMIAQSGGEEDAAEDEWILATDGALELHPDNNVLVFILDAYDEQILEKVLAEDPDFLAPLDGFTYYPNATSLYAYTSTSLPYLLSDVEWPVGMELSEYADYAFEQGGMLDDIADAGYAIDIYTDMKYITGANTGKLRNYVPYDRPACDTWDTVRMMDRCARYQMAPYMIKYRYWYTTDALQALSRNEGHTKDWAVWATYNDHPFYNALTQTGLTSEKNAGYKGDFKFYHMYGAHPPYHLKEDLSTETEDRLDYDGMISQAKGSLKVVFEYIRQLQSLDGGGSYDNATIVITADHGHHSMYEPDVVNFRKGLQLGDTSTPILLVKKAHQTWEGVRENDAPVSHTEMIAEIMAAINPEAAADYGRTLDEVPETEERTRRFIYVREDLSYINVEIRGDARDPDNWTIIEKVPAKD